MQTQLMDECAVGVPWLENETGEKTPLVSAPFSIGRIDSADLQVDSSRVSREHAVIIREGDNFRVRDLGSTNGTFVNGEPIKESPLTDGDVLGIADAEYTFYVGKAPEPGAKATQVMTSPRSSTAALEVIRAVRRLHEALTHRCMRVAFQPVVSLETNSVFGYQAIGHGLDQRTTAQQHQAVPMSTECRLTARIRQLVRTLAVEEASYIPGGMRLFLALDPSEIEVDPLIDEEIALLRDQLPDEWSLVASLPETAVSEMPHVQALREALGRHNIAVAYDGFVGGQTQVMQHEHAPPEFLILGSTMAKELHESENRQRQMQAVLQASKAIGCDVIATGLEDERDVAAARKFGCAYAQGRHFGEPLPVRMLLEKQGA